MLQASESINTSVKCQTNTGLCGICSSSPCPLASCAWGTTANLGRASGFRKARAAVAANKMAQSLGAKSCIRLAPAKLTAAGGRFAALPDASGNHAPCPVLSGTTTDTRQGCSCARIVRYEILLNCVCCARTSRDTRSRHLQCQSAGLICANRGILANYHHVQIA